MPSQPTWVLVANSSRAKIYRMTKSPKLEEISQFEHPESRMLTHDLVSDSRPGRGKESTGPTRHAYQQRTSPKLLEVEKFAKDISAHIDAAFANGEFQRLYLLASPSFLGHLRKYLDSKTQSSIVGEGAVDLTEQPQSDIEKHLSSL